MEPRPPDQTGRGFRTVFLEIVHVLDLVDGKALGDVRRTPAGGHEPDPRLVPPALRAPRVFRQQPEMLEVDPDRIPRAGRPRDAVDRRHVVQLFLEGSEQAVPPGENLSQVLVEIFRIDGVVHAVLRRRDDHVLEQAELGHVLRVIPELQKKVNRSDQVDHFGRHARDGRRDQKQRIDADDVGDRLPQRAGQVELFAAVVDDVVVPEEVDPVVEPVRPITREVYGEKGDGVEQPGGLD